MYHPTFTAHISQPVLDYLFFLTVERSSHPDSTWYIRPSSVDLRPLLLYPVSTPCSRLRSLPQPTKITFILSHPLGMLSGRSGPRTASSAQISSQNTGTPFVRYLAVDHEQSGPLFYDLRWYKLSLATLDGPILFQPPFLFKPGRLLLAFLPTP